MKKLILKITGFLLPLILLIGIMEIGLRNVQNEYTLKADLYMQQRDTIETLYMGASPTAYGIDPSLIGPHAFNMGNFYQLLDQDMLLAQDLAADMPKLKLVVFNLIPPIMELSSQGTKLEQLSYQYHSLYGTKLEQGSDWFDLRAYSNIALFGYRNSISYLFRGFHVSLTNGLKFTEQGFVNEERTGTAPHALDAPAMKDQLSRLITPYYDEGNFQPNQQKLERVIHKLQSRNIAVAIVLSPVTPQYAVLYETSYNRTKAYVADLRSRYAIHSYDFFQDSRFHSEDFQDYLHLNSEGAVKFSQILKEEVDSH